MCKKYFKVIITLLLLVEFTFVFLSIKSFNNKDITKIKEENKVNKEMFSMYVENKDGDYVEYTDSEYYPIGLKYYFNEERSNCTDNKGKVVNDVLTYNNNKITVSSNKTLFCYLYFDLDKVPPQTFTFYLGGNTNPEYINKTSTTAYLSWTDNDITSYCINTENNSSTCSWISTTGNSVTPSYTISTQGSNTRYAFIRDAAENISPVVSDVVFLDSVAPVITSASDSGSGTANVTVTETGSGVSHVCVNTSSTSTTGCVWDEVSGTTFTSTTAVTSTSNYYIHVKDKAGNIGHRTSAISIAAPPMNLKLLCSSYTNIGTCMAGEYGSSKLKEIANISPNEYGQMYRYIHNGTYSDETTTTNNYICFGTSDKSTCISNQDTYMYRIIGVNSSGQLKVIKVTSIGTSQWYSSYDSLITWPNSLIYKQLNQTFLNNKTYIPTGWESKIATTSWKYGYFTSSNTLSVYSSEMYNTEMTYYTNSVSAKIGLMYLHDFIYSGTNNDQKCSGSYQYQCGKSWLHLNEGDNPKWTISSLYFASSITKGKAAYINTSSSTGNSSGGIDYIAYTANYNLHPVFYLTFNIIIIGGTGTIDNPYIIN